MATYIALCKLTERGMSAVKDTTKRAAAFKEAASKYGVEMTQIYWTLGRYDLIAIIEARDEASAAAFGLAVGVAGSIRLETLRAFSAEEMGPILSKLG